MQVKIIAEWEHSAILSIFIKLPFVIEIFVLSIFEWPFYTGFTVCCVCEQEVLKSFTLIELVALIIKHRNLFCSS